MTHWTQGQLDEFNARRDSWVLSNDNPDPGPESKLQSKCLAYCRDHGWPVFHDWSMKTNKAGFPDLFIFTEGGRMILIELKSGNAKLRTEQQALHRQLNWLGHKVHVVRSYKRFLEIMEG